MGLTKTMKSAGLALLGVAFLSAALVACSKSPMLQDLEALDKLADTSFSEKALHMPEISRKLAAAKTNLEKAPLILEISANLEKAVKDLSAFKPLTPEMQGVAASLMKGMQDMSDAMKIEADALAHDNPELAKDAVKKIQAAQALSMKATKEFEELSKKNDYKPNRV